MRIVPCSACLLLALSTSFAFAQQRPGETPPAPAPAPVPPPPPPVPDQDGVYSMVPGIQSPYLTSPALAALPADIAPDRPRFVRFSAVIAADGSLTNLTPLNPQGDVFDAAATTAIQQSKFAPGTLNGTAVPVLVCLRVPFIHVQPAIPRLSSCSPPGVQVPGGPLRLPAGTTPPHAIHIAIPEYSDEARRKKIQGVVLVSTLVTEQGEPTDVRVEKGLGYGLDENAIAAVSKYHFQPAMDRDGKPVAVRIHIEVSYQLY
jgi:TonB family protein